MNGSLSIKTWLVIGVPLVSFAVGMLAVGSWEGEITNRIKVVEAKAEKNETNAKINEQGHRDEMWAMRSYLHSLDKNVLAIATKLKIPRSELSVLELEIPKR